MTPTTNNVGPTTSATERLRALLTERGVEWRGGLPTETMVEADGLDLLYVALPDGRVRAFIRNYLTPERAVEATLGRGTCSIRGGECDQCGAHIHRDAVLFWVPAGEGLRTVESRDVSYCPNCGARVIGEDA